MLKALAPLLLLLLSLPPAVTPPPSCLTCPQTVQGPPCQEFWRADAVFVGYVTEAVPVDWANTNVVPTSQYRSLTARLAVVEALRGVEDTEATFEMNDCPYPFRQGERYLVYAHRDRGGKLYLRIGSSRTRPLSEAGEDLAYIRGLSQAGGGGRIFGTVSRDTSDYRLRAGGAEAGRRGSGGVPGVKVIAESGGHSHETKTDAEGRFEFSGLPAGAYRVRAETPAGDTGVRVESRSGISVPDRGCAPYNIHLMSEGEIGGLVASAAGQPAKDARVTLFSAEEVTDAGLANLEGSPPVMMYTDVHGRYRFVNVPAGRYYVAVSVPVGDGPKDVHYRRAFHPNAAGLAEATAISLVEGQKKADADVQLPPQ